MSTSWFVVCAQDCRVLSPWVSAVMSSSSADTIDVSFFKKTDRRTKFVARIPTPIPVSHQMTKGGCSAIIEKWMDATGNRIENYTRERLIVEVKYAGGEEVKLTNMMVISNVKHYKATYDASSTWKAEEEPSMESQVAQCVEKNPHEIVLTLQCPYRKEEVGTAIVGSAVPMEEVIQTINQMLYDKKKHGALGASAPCRVNITLPFGAPIEGYTPPDRRLTFTQEEVDELIEKTRKETADRIHQHINRMNDDDDEDAVDVGGVRVVALDEGTDIGEVISQIRSGGLNPTQQPTQQAPEVPATGGYVPFSGAGMKLDEPEAEVINEIISVKDDKALSSEDELIADDGDRWESEVVPLNPKNDGHTITSFIKIDGAVIYKYHSGGDATFGDLFKELTSVGLQTGAPLDKNAKYNLGFQTSRAYNHEKMSDWGGDQATYVLMPKAKAKSKATSSSSSSK
eukprot:s2465_g2.t1